MPFPKMKPLFLALTLSLAFCFATHAKPPPPAVPGETLTEAEVQGDVVALLTKQSQALAPDCKTLRVTDTKIVKLPESMAVERGTGLAVMQWAERWQLERCGRKIAYLIYFDTRGSAGTAFKVEEITK